MEQEIFQKKLAEALEVRNEGNYAEALGRFKEIAREATGIQVGETFHYMGTTMQRAKRFHDAIEMLDTARKVREVVGDVIGIALTRFQTTMCLWIQAEQRTKLSPTLAFQLAASYIEKALQEETTEKQEGDLRHNLAFCKQVIGDFTGALKDYKKVLRIRRVAQDKHGEGLTLLRIAECFVALEDHYLASRMAKDAEAIFTPDVVHDKNRMKQLEELQSKIKAMTVA